MKKSLIALLLCLALAVCLFAGSFVTALFWSSWALR